MLEEEAYTVLYASPVSNPDGQPTTNAGAMVSRTPSGRGLLTRKPERALQTGNPTNPPRAISATTRNDIVVIGLGRCALLIDEPRDSDETPCSDHRRNSSSLQLAELEAYDRLLDDALERSYRDLGEQLRSRGRILRSQKGDGSTSTWRASATLGA